MKNKILIIALTLISAIVYSQNQYQQGFNDGFKNGYCHGTIAGCVAPIAPIAPVDLTMNYQTGYNNGFVAGKNEKNRQNNSQSSNTGGAYGQLKPVETITPVIIAPNYDPERARKQWEAYYEKRAAKKEENEERNHVILVEYYKLSYKIERLENEYSKRNILSDFNKNKLKRIKDKSDFLLKKYKNRPKKFTDFIYEITKLDLELNDVNYEITNSK